MARDPFAQVLGSKRGSQRLRGQALSERTLEVSVPPGTYSSLTTKHNLAAHRYIVIVARQIYLDYEDQPWDDILFYLPSPVEGELGRLLRNVNPQAFLATTMEDGEAYGLYEVEGDYYCLDWRAFRDVQEWLLGSGYTDEDRAAPKALPIPV